MNRRNLLKSLFAVPLAALGMNKTLAAFAAPANQKIQQGITNTWLDNITVGLNPVYVKSRFSGTIRILETAATHKDTYQLDSVGNIKQLLSREYLVDRDCNHAEWIVSPGTSDPAGLLAETYPHGGLAPKWLGKCLKCSV